jgi:glycogen debranching enzyme
MYVTWLFLMTEHTLLKLQDVGLERPVTCATASASRSRASLGREEESELRERAQAFRDAMQQLWSEEFGLFLNRHTDTGELSTRISPTNFYALLADAATPQQAQRMIEDTSAEPAGVLGRRVLPSIARSDPAMRIRIYWRGRIWAPMTSWCI